MKIYIIIKIDEGNNLGVVKIRMRFLKVVMFERESKNIDVKNIKVNRI